MDIYELLFYDILKFDYSTSVLTGEFGNDILYGLLIPAILIYLVLAEFTSFVAGTHEKVKHLVTIAALGVIIQSGWYATIASMSGMYLPIALLYFLLVFAKRKLITRKQEGAGAGLFGKAMEISGMNSRINAATNKLIPKRPDGDVNGAVYQIAMLGQSYKTTMDEKESVFGSQSNKDESLRMIAEQAKSILDGFNATQKKDIVKALSNKGLNVPFLTELQILIGYTPSKSS